MAEARYGGAEEKRPVTSSDVARLAGVSQPTVSRAFSDSARLSDATKKRVLEAARQLGYRPNAIARSLVSSRTNIVGVIVMRNESPFYNEMVNLLVVACRKYGYCAMVIRQTEHESGLDTVTRALEYRVDGLLVTAIENTQSAYEICRQTTTPIVLFNRYIIGANVDTVSCDNYDGGGLVADYLISKGHRRIACLMGEERASTTKERLLGIRARAEAESNDLDVCDILYGDYTYESGREMCRRLLEKGGERPSAIFCSGDIIAFGVLDTLRLELGLRVPEDISVIGFDDTREAAWASYDLTTIRQPYTELADAACKLLMERIEHPDGSVKRSLHCGVLVERGSVADIMR